MKNKLRRNKELGDSLNLEELEALLAQAKANGWADFYIRANSWGYDGADIIANYIDIETDEEYSARLEREESEARKKEAKKQTKREKDRALYEKLKKEFGE